MKLINTDRLIIRPWEPKDREPFAALNADPRVMEYFPRTLTREESDNFISLMEAHQAEFGYCFFATTLKDGTFIGMIGLNNIRFEVPFTPRIEIGWRLAFDHWNKGYATEGAKAVLNYGFQEKNFEEIVAYTTVTNQRSRDVMTKIGMTYDPQADFDHPKLEHNHPLKKHVVYRIQNTNKRLFGMEIRE